MQQNNRFHRRPRPQRVPINEYIRFPELRVIGSDGEQLGVMKTEDALAKAREEDLDLVVVVATQKPPVAKIIDYGKHKFEQDKQKKEQKKKNKAQGVHKEVKMTPRIGEHDYQVKLRKILEGLNNGYKVRVISSMRGREMAHPELAKQVLERVLKDIEDAGKPDNTPPIKREGRSFALQLAPIAKQ